MRQSQFAFRQVAQMWCEDDATGVARPMQHVETCIVLWQQRIAGIAKDRFDKVEVADQAAGSKKADFHRLVPTETWEPPDRPADAPAATQRSAIRHPLVDG